MRTSTGSDGYEIIQNDLQIALNEFDKYFNFFNGGNGIKGKSVCELGPGAHFGIGLLFKCLGADQVCIVDKYPKPWSDDYHPLFYRELAETAMLRWPGINVTPLHETSKKGHEFAPLQFWDDDAEHLTSIGNSCIDFLYSTAVLEHLYCPEDAFRQFARITRPGGKGMHQVDFRNHFDMERPLEFLLYPFWWNKPVSPKSMSHILEKLAMPREAFTGSELEIRNHMRRFCGYFGNTYRYADYHRLWEDNDFSINSFTPNMFAEDSYLDDFISRLAKTDVPAAAMSRKELAVISGLYVVTRK